jgi:hypothetical protein
MNNRSSSRVIRHLVPGVLLSALLLAVCLPASAQGPMRATHFPMAADGFQYDNWVQVGLAGPYSLTGDQAHYRQRHRIPGGPFLGVSDLHVEQFIGDDAILSLDGRAIYDNRDYRATLRYEHMDLGFARAGFRTFRTFYDGSGGFFPGNDAWFAPHIDEMGMDRGETFLEAGLRADGAPRLTLGYTRQFRQGQKSSTSWGETNLTDGAGARKIAPGFWDTDEVRHILEGRARHAIGLADVQVGLRYERADINNSRNALRRPGEAPERVMTQHEGSLSNTFHGHAITTLRLHANARLTTSYAFTTQSGDLSGSRIFGADYGPTYDPLFASRQQRDGGFLDLAGTTRVRHHIANANLMIRPWSTLTIVPSVRLEKRDVDVALDYLDTYVGSPPALATAETPYEAINERSLVDLAGELEVRYTGLRNLTLYTRGSWLEGTGDLMSRQQRIDTGDVTLLRSTDDRRATQRYTAGANWHPIRGLNVGVQAFRRHRNLTFDHLESPRGPARYPAFLTAQDRTTDNLNVRVRWRAMSGLTLGARYDYQRITVGAEAAEMAHLRTGDITRQVLSQSLTWAPAPRFFIQGNLNYVIDRSETPPNLFTDDAADIIQMQRNDYISANLSSRYALTNRIDLEADYYLYRADNFVDNSAVSLPLGAGCEEHGLSAGLGWLVNERIRLTGRYLFFLHRDEASGGHSNYDLHLINTGIQYRF